MEAKKLEISDIISEEDVDDHFLRIKEILGYEYRVDDEISSKFYKVTIFKTTLEFSKELYDEIEHIKKRIEAIYPHIYLSQIVEKKFSLIIFVKIRNKTSRRRF